MIALAAANPPSCHLVVGSFVSGEWHKNAPTVRSELERRLNRMDEEAELFHSLCGRLAIPVAFGRPRYVASGFGSRLTDLSLQLLQSAVSLAAHPDTNGRAYERVAITQRRPCRKGGELKDCTIFEEYLEVCQLLKATPFARKLIFCSSNTDDYCSPGVVPHADVADDCSAAGLLFTTTLPWAVSELKT
ncbi:hypothetical protein [Frigoriglobus tundricola]|uniref:Uncharacterized protein n=1 Tax=Frigoriglobus tundricola TaxID=2774151 RepID=A0A6M5YTF0_9BACT|nr:hypothetical protein [Frigoriglobus tundricola]QJW96212.1 hypothetical protein FTUN_3769 [Frigoriglobus tundricola]